jgi:hypothetical protein
MKSLKILFVGLFISILTSCSSDVKKNDESSNSLKTVKETTENVDFSLLAEQTKNELDALLLSERLTYESLFLGELDENETLTSSSLQSQILSLYAKWIAQEVSYDANFSQFVFLSEEDNNGYAMLISSGVCSLSAEKITVSIDVKVNQRKQLVSLDPAPISKVTCTGCSSGCSPRRYKNGDGYCTSCDSYTSHECVKTESI